MRHTVLGLLVGLGLIFGTAGLLAAQRGAAPAPVAGAAAPVQGTPTPTPTASCGWTRYPLSQTFPQARELYDIAALSASDIWAVGIANNVGVRFSTATLHWDGQTWNHVPSPDVGTDENYLYGVGARASNDVWAVGTAYSSGSYIQMMILHWDGTQWSVVPTPTGFIWSRLYNVVAPAANDAWAVGASDRGTVLLHWNGSQWSVAPLPPNNNSVSALAALAPNDVWATGSDILRWNGAQWNVLSYPNPANATQLISVAARTTNDAWAVGSYYLNGVGQTVTEHWDGLQWSLIASPNLQYSTTLEGVAVRSANDAWAVGSSGYSAYDQAPLAEHWDGATWQIVPFTENLPSAVGLHAVAAVGANDVWTVGFFNGWTSGSPQPLVLHWNGACPFLSATPTVTGTPPTATMTGTPTATDTPTDIPTATPTPTMHPGHFEDVPPAHTFYTYVECLAYQGIISGYPCGGPFEPCRPEQIPYYRPGNNVTRSQAGKIVASAAGFAEPIPSDQQTFADVPPGSTFWLWIERLAGRGIIQGYPCGGPFEPCQAPGNRPYFRPGNNLTRGQLAKIAAQAAGFSDPIPSDQQTFEDVPGGSTFWLWVEQAAIRQIIGGYPCGGPFEPCIAPGNRPYYRPGNNVTRGQSAKILANTFFPSCQVPTPTPSRTPVPLSPTRTPSVTITGTPPTPTGTATATPCPSIAWTTAASIPVLKGRAAGASTGTAIYLFGGRPDITTYTTDIWRYDLAANTWSTSTAVLPDLQTSNMAAGLLTFPEGPRILVVGGNGTGSTYTGRALAFDPVGNTLTPKTAWPAAPARLPGGWTVYNNKFYIFGGIDTTSAAFADNWVYDPTTNAWTQLPNNLSLARGYIAVEAVGSKIYIAGGSQINVGGLTDETIFEIFDPATNAITAGPALPTAKSNNQGYRFNGKFWVVGGAYTTPEQLVYVYDPGTNTWTIGLPLDSTTRNYARGYGADGSLFAIGGLNDRGASISFNQHLISIVPCATPAPLPTQTPGGPSATPEATATRTVTRTATALSPSPTPTPTP